MANAQHGAAALQAGLWDAVAGAQSPSVVAGRACVGRMLTSRCAVFPRYEG